MESQLGAGEQERGQFPFPTPISTPDPYSFQLNFTGFIVFRDPQRGSSSGLEGFSFHTSLCSPVIANVLTSPASC